MTIAYNLSPMPKWVIMNNEGTAAGGAKLYTYRSLNKTQEKAVYQDDAGTVPWTNPILFDANGTEGPFYWKTDSANTNDTYYLEAYDSNDNLLWTLDDYFPPSGSGGGSSTTYYPINNLIANSVFIDHINDTANPIGVTNLLVAPSNHKGFTPALITPVVGTNGVVGPDIRLVKNNTNATDQITFVDFSLSDGPLTADVTPAQYLRYQCTNAPASETYKSFQFPICQKVKNLAGTQVTFRVWIKSGSGTPTVSLYSRQYFGSGGSPSAEVRTLQGTISLTTSWQNASIQFTVPSVAGKSVGTSGQQTDDDALYLQLDMPLGQACDIWFTKPALYVGTIDPDINFVTYDEIYGISQTPRTGEVMTSYQSSAPGGWVAMNDGSIGNTGTAATNRANKDTFQLFKTLWDGVSDTYAPVATGRGASAVADFSAGKIMTLPLTLGRALAAAGTGTGLTARTLGQYLGTETISIADMPAHNHPGSTVPSVDGAGAASPNSARQSDVTANTIPLTIASQGGSAADGKMQPTSFVNVFIKL